MCDQCWDASFGRRRALGLLGAVAVAPFAARGRRARPASAARAVPVAEGLQVLPREAWAAGLDPTGALVGETVQFLLVHHTAGPTTYDEDFVPGHLRDIYAFHTGPDKGWPDVCYNFFVDRFGRVWEGRAGSLGGAVMADATGGSQGFAQLVCLLGDFTSVSPTPEAIGSLQRTLAWLAGRHGIDTAPGATTQFVSRGSNRWAAGTSVTTPTIAGHRDMSFTACPGDTFYPYVHDQLQAAVHELRGGSAAVVPSPTTVVPTVPPSPTTSLPSGTAPAAPGSSVPASDVPSTPPPTEPGTSGFDVSVESSTSPSAAAAAPSSTVTEPIDAVDDDAGEGGTVLPWFALAAGGGALIGGSVVALRRREPSGSGDVSEPD